MNEKDPDECLTARLNVKCHPDLLKSIRKIAKKSGIYKTSTVVRMWLTECVERELAKDNLDDKGQKPRKGYVNH
jgi:hypothetical protein